VHNLDWRDVHSRCQSVATRAAALDREIARALLDGERLFGLAPKVTLERLRVAAALESLPLLDDALATGRVCYSAARELTRVAVATTEGAWLAASAHKAVREIEELVSGHLRSMGWKEREARQAVDAIRPHVGPDEPIESVLRRCLAVMRIPTRPPLALAAPPPA
jgi:hypothetical protein